jgi:leucyl-tRNA synthetase
MTKEPAKKPAAKAEKPAQATPAKKAYQKAATVKTPAKAPRSRKATAVKAAQQMLIETEPPVATPDAVTVAPPPTATPAGPTTSAKKFIERYDPKAIEAKWQAQWEADQLYRAVIDPNKPKHYALTMLPYPSGNLHIGHWYAMTPSDARARYMRMKGYNVLFPMGFDAFGLPAENAAIKDGVHPLKRTYANIAYMRGQLRSMGAMFDWQREAVSCDAEYYKWTQWFFNQLFRHGLAHKKLSPVDWCPRCNTTLAREQVWGDDRHCERCDTPVIKKNLEQWYFRTTKYADELLKFDGLDWPTKVRDMQTNWIGRSEGAEVKFRVASEQSTVNSEPLFTEPLITVFTTRPDTLWGATFMVLAPEHPLVAQLTTPACKAAVEAYVAEATRQTDIDREATDKEKTGVFIGAYALNPVSGERIPIWIADYVLMTYGTGAIMAVPAHDERDFAFALKFGLPILPVIERTDGLTKSFALGGTMHHGFAEALHGAGIPFEERQGSLYITIPPEKIARYIELARNYVRPDSWNEIIGTQWLFIFHDGIWQWDSLEAERRILARCHELEHDVRNKRSVMEMVWAVEFYRDALYHNDYGAMIHAGKLTGTPGAAAKPTVIAALEAQGVGKGTTTYRLRDWLISRQRYWGAPIPIVYCPTHGQVPVPDDQLPVRLPEDVEWLPTGQSPLKLHPTWSKTTCPICGGPAERDTDTMDTFMCSSWYHLRYLSPTRADVAFDEAEYNYWMPVDTYTGGAEHATMHLIYTRFFHKALRDMEIIPPSHPEPMTQLRNQGQILGPDNQRMSKSRGNVIDPDEQVRQYGADVVRAYLMFGYDWSEGGPWNTENIQGVVRWVNRVWALAQDEEGQGPRRGDDAQHERELRRVTHQTIKRAQDDLEQFQFNTVVSALMELTNALYRYRDTVENTPAWNEAIQTLLLLSAPITPHIAEELWARRGLPYSIHQQAWPKYDAALAAEDLITIVVQVNGKVRDRVQVPAGTGEAEIKAAAQATAGAQRFMEGQAPIHVVYVPGRLVNIVV